MDSQEQKAFILSLIVAFGAATLATVVGYYIYKYYTQTYYHPDIINKQNNKEE